MDQALGGVKEIGLEVSVSAGAGTAVTEGMAVILVDVGYAAVVTPYGSIQNILELSSLVL